MRVQSSSSIVLGLLFKLSVNNNKHHRININTAAAAFSTTTVFSTNFGLRTRTFSPETITTSTIRSSSNNNGFHFKQQQRQSLSHNNNNNNMSNSGFSMITESMTVADIVTYHPSTSNIFDKYKIDYCCGGNIPLNSACETLSNIDTATILRELNKETSSTMSSGDDNEKEKKKNWGKEENIDLITSYIIKKYHNPLRMDLKGLDGLMEKVVRVHGENHPELVLMKLVFDGLSDELKTHMMKEENILFPYMKAIYASWLRDRDDGQNTSPPPPSHHCGSVTNPIHQMEVEHQSAGKALVSLRELSQDYTVPLDGCNSYKALFRGLEKVENDLHRHIHLENYVLHPLATRMEQEIIQIQQK